MKRVFHRIFDVIKTLLLFAAVIALIILLLDHAEQQDRGFAQVVDGDSLVLNGQRIRLEGIDAPERSQMCERSGQDYACGTAARAHLQRLIDGKQVHCISAGRDRYDRLLAHCHVGDIDLNKTMVRDGWAVDYGGYLDVQLLAKKDKAGLWAGRFETPQVYRDAKRLGEMGAVGSGPLREFVQLIEIKVKRMGTHILNQFDAYRREE